MISRRQFLASTSGVAASLPFFATTGTGPNAAFQHGVTSPAFDDAVEADLAQEILLSTPLHLRYVDLFHRGYVLLDVDARRMQAEWYFTPSVRRHASREIFDYALRAQAGSNRLGRAAQPSLPKADIPPPAPRPHNNIGNGCPRPPSWCRSHRPENAPHCS